jgi:hypothetical protein
MIGNMILPHKCREYFKFVAAKVSLAMAQYSSSAPYFLDDNPVIANYEILREVWFDSVPIKNAGQSHNLSRSQYYEREERFVKKGISGLFPELKTLPYSPMIERLVVMVSKARLCIVRCFNLPERPAIIKIA